MITRDMLTAHEDIVIPAILAIAKEREGGRRVRTLAEADVRVFLATVKTHPDESVRVYANRGEFVPRSYKYRAPITILEYWPDEGDKRGGACVSETDAKRARGKGPWVTVNGRREV